MNTDHFQSSVKRSPTKIDLDKLSRLNNSVLSDYELSKTELNSFYQFKDKSLYKEYLLYNLNTKPYGFITLIIAMYTCTLFPVKVLYFLYFPSHEITPLNLFLQIALSLPLVSLLVTGWFMVCKKHQVHFPPSVWKLYIKPYWRLVKKLFVRKANHIHPSSSSRDDAHSAHSVDNRVLFKPPAASEQNRYSFRLHPHPSRKQHRHYLGEKYAVLQHILAASIMIFNIMVLINQCIGENCADYKEPHLNALLRNCGVSFEQKGLQAKNYALGLMVSPIFFCYVFKECLFEFHLANHMITMFLSFLFARYYHWSTAAHLMLIIWTILGLTLILDIHVQNVASFLTYHELKETLLEKERLTEQNNASEMRHMIGNVAHDLKTPLSSFTTGLDIIADIVRKHENFVEAFTPSMKAGPEEVASTNGIKRLGDFCKSIDECLKNIRDTNTFMLMTINRCIDYTKASRGFKLVPKYETVDLLETLRLPLDCMKNIQERIDIRLVPLDVEICSHIITDKQWLQENILCLLSNAVKYSAGGEVTIKVYLTKILESSRKKFRLLNSLYQSTKDPTKLKSPNDVADRNESKNEEAIPIFDPPQSQEKAEELESDDDNDSSSTVIEYYLRFDIEDSGIGLSAEMMGQLFNPFRQAQRLAGGTGLGLYSLAKRVEALGGDYGVSKRNDGRQGSLFWFSVPYRADQSTAKTINMSTSSAASSEIISQIKNEKFIANGNAPSPISKRPDLVAALNTEAILQRLRCLHILLVDDSPSIIKMSSMMLKRQGHHIQVAENGDIALKKIQEQWEVHRKGFDVILMDLQMPVMDGLEATRRLRAMEREGRDWMSSTPPPAQASTLLKTNDGDYGAMQDLEGNLILDLSRPQILKVQIPAVVNPPSFRHALIGVSANSDHETMTEALKAGVDAFMAKPFSIDLFHTTLVKVMTSTGKC